MKLTKENNAITLVALVITIIVMIILAAVSLNMVFGENGIITKAKLGKSKFLGEDAREVVEQRVASLKQEMAQKGAEFTLYDFWFMYNSEFLEDGTTQNTNFKDDMAIYLFEDTLGAKKFKSGSASIANTTNAYTKNTNYQTAIVVYNDYVTAIDSNVNVSKNVVAIDEVEGVQSTLENLTPTASDKLATGNLGTQLATLKVAVSNSAGGGGTPVSNVPGTDLGTGSTNTNNTTLGYVNYYADINGDGQIDIDNDGLIFADLSVSKSGQYGSNGNYGTFSYTAIPESDLKKYKMSVSTADPTGGVGAKYFISWDKVSSGQDRFYVVALKDLANNSYSSLYWWYSAYGNISTSNTARTFGSGRQNTANIMQLWNNNTYNHNARDMWSLYSDLNDATKAKWFIPSEGELGAMLSNLGINSSNYSNTYKLSSYYYWSSSLYSSDVAYRSYVINGYISITNFNIDNYVRLVATF